MWEWFIGLHEYNHSRGFIGAKSFLKPCKCTFHIYDCCGVLPSHNPSSALTNVSVMPSDLLCKTIKKMLLFRHITKYLLHPIPTHPSTPHVKIHLFSYISITVIIHKWVGWYAVPIRPFTFGCICYDQKADTNHTYCWVWLEVIIKTPSSGNIFRATGPLYGKFTGPRWIPRTKASDAELWCLLWSASE